MRKLLLLLLGILLIVLLSYYCFKTKTEAIKNHLLSSAEVRYSEESLEEISVTVKGEELNTTRILVLRGEVKNIEEKVNAGKIAQSIHGVYAVENHLGIKDIISSKNTHSINKDKELIKKVKALVPEVNSSNLTTPKLMTDIKEVEIEKIKSTLENLVSSTVLSDASIQEKVDEPIVETALTCEENLREQLSKEKIHFEYNKALIKEDSNFLLNGLVEILKTCSNNMVHIEGHTDSIGSQKYNQMLSQKRANAVRTYFIKHGISKLKLKARGYGELHPIATNKTKAGKKLNRRIEFKIKGVK